MSEAVLQRLQKFQEKLLDLTKRNRLLNFRAARVSSVRIVDELPAEVFSLLFRDRKALSFSPRLEDVPSPADEPASRNGAENSGTADSDTETETETETAALAGTETSTEAAALADGTPDTLALPRESAACDRIDDATVAAPSPLAVDDEDGTLDEEGPAIFTRQYQPYTAEHVAPRHRDRILQTDLDVSRLDYNLLRIHQQARSALEEQGFNTLFLAVGAVEWFEAEAPRRPLLAPILLLPVELRRRSPRSPFHLHATEEDPLLNPSLAMLLDRELRAELPELPDDIEQLDVQALFQEVSELVHPLPGWRVLNDTWLGLFSFTKFIMYKDLEAFSPLYAENPLVRRLCGEDADVGSPGDNADVGSPGDNADEEAAPTQAEPERSLDESTDPRKIFQVLDADSSQQEAILAIRSGKSLVLEGPPGTGKSQTITNVIAECLSAGQRVLFVSEKMAALEVVFNRLREVGLADFCLELHSRHASKRQVIEELSRTLSIASEAPASDGEQALDQLRGVREQLNGYVDGLTTPLEPLGVSPFEALERAVELEDAREVRAPLQDIETWPRERLDGARELLERLAGAWRSVRERFPDRDAHPWRGSSLEALSYQSSIAIRQALESALQKLERVRETAPGLAELACVRTPETLDGCDELCDLVDLLLESPRPAPKALQDSAWTGPGEEVRLLLRDLEAYQERIASWEGRWSESLLETDLDGLLARGRARPGLGRFLKPGWWRDRKTLCACAQAERVPPHEQLVGDLERAREARELRSSLRERRDRGLQLFGVAWHGESSDLRELNRVTDWIVSYRRFLEGEAIENRLRIACEGVDDAASTRDMRQALGDNLNELRESRADLRDAAALDERLAFDGAAEGRPFEFLATRLGEMNSELDALHDHGRLVAADRACREEHSVLGVFIDQAIDENLEPDELGDAFERAFWYWWLDHALSQRRELTQFSRENHTRAIREFRDLDLRQLFIARERLRGRLLESLPDGTWEASAKSELGILQREVRRKRGHKPLRKLFQLIPNALVRLKPCFLMSPLSVAQYLDPGKSQFDVVIFDEASQIAPEDALGAIARSKQLVVVGDSRQLPPTSFFQVDASQDTEDDDTPDLESILDECIVAGFPRRLLRWHYRSRHESLISFSNELFYDGRLHTFPSVSCRTDRAGVSLRYLEDAVYDRGKTQSNPREADEVARAVFEHFRERPHLSLGVGTFSQAQQVAILDRIEELRRKDESLENFFGENLPEHFFIKNLENIQGDERDVIFLSVGYGPDASGKVHLNFGPLNKSGGERRLNVLVTRARRQLVVFSSLRASDIDPARLSSRGGLLLRQYLEYAERGGSASTRAATPERDASGAIVRAVTKRLEEAGYVVDPLVGNSRSRLDLAVRTAASEGEEGADGGERYLLGIECDGASYREADTARDRDRLRQQVLEGLGWRLYPIWSVEWFRNQRTEAQRLEEMLEKARDGRLEAEVLPLLARFERAGPPVSRRRPTDDQESGAAADGGAVADYELVATEACGEPDEFEADNERIGELVARVVNVEAPIHIDELARRVASAWGISRITRSVVREVEALVARQLEAGEIERGSESEEGAEFLWRAGDRKAPPRRRTEGAPREPELLCLEELTEAAELVLSREFRMGRDDLTARVAKLLGYQRTGKKLRDRIGLGIDRLLAEGRIQEREGSLELASEMA